MPLLLSVRRGHSHKHNNNIFLNGEYTAVPAAAAGINTEDTGDGEPVDAACGESGASGKKYIITLTLSSILLLLTCG